MLGSSIFYMDDILIIMFADDMNFIVHSIEEKTHTNTAKR